MMPWYVVEEPWPTAHPTGLKRFPYEAPSKSALPMNFSYISGPYRDKTEAQAAVNKGVSAPGGPVTGGTQPPQSQAGVPNLPNPLSGIERVGAVLESFYKALTDGKMWRSVGWLLLGIALVIAGLFLWLKREGMTPSVVPIPV